MGVCTMNQYIVTEEKLTTLKFCEDLLTRHEIVKEIRSHPYQNEREKALNYLVDTFSDIGYKNHPTTQMIKNLIKKDEELWKAGE
jgi:hypothetical protein